MSFYLSFLLSILVNLVRGYYLSPNELSNEAAEEYCELQCNSHLSSFHNIKDYTNAIHAIKHNPFMQPSLINDIWIGLVYDNTTHQVQWTDDSSTDFVNHIYFKSDEDCAVLSLSDDTLQLKPCDEQRIFLCNSCDLMINKYVIIASEMDYLQSNHKCNTKFGTTLASIHSNIDHDEATLLCYLATNKEDKSCWIGLNDIQYEGVYQWTDDTTLDFGRNISGGVYPWSHEFIDGEWMKQPNAYDMDIDCVDLWQKKQYNIHSFDFNDDDCNIIQPFICNLPSNLCDTNEWYTVSGEWIFDDDSCDLYNYYDVNTDVAMLMNMMDTSWHYVLIDYMFKIFDAQMNGTSGITIGLSNDFDRHYIFYIGFIVSNDDDIQLFISYDGSLLGSVDVTDIYNIGDFYALKIALDEDGMIKVYTNDKIYIEYDTQLLDIPTQYVINSIGIQNKGVSVHAKYVYISGTDTTESTINTDNINLRATLQPLNTQISQTIMDNGQRTNRNTRRLITFTVTNLVLLLAAVIGGVCILLCACFNCVLYIKKTFSIKKNMDTMTEDRPSHVPQYSSVDITLETDNVLQRQETKDLELADIEEDHDRYLGAKNDEVYAGNRVMESFDEYVTKGSQIVNILHLPLPKTPNTMESGSMDEGYCGRQRDGYDIICADHMAVSGVSDIFGSVFEKETDQDVLEIMNQSCSENEKLNEEQQTKSSVYF